MIRNEKTATLDDVLNELVAEYERPTSEALDTWAERYPQFRRELIDFVAAWAEQMVLPEAPELTADEEERIVDRVMSHALNVSFKRDGEAQARLPGERHQQPDWRSKERRDERGGLREGLWARPRPDHEAEQSTNLTGDDSFPVG